MQQSFDVMFATSNKFKFAEAKIILSKYDIRLGRKQISLQEIQSDNSNEIAKQKALFAYDKLLNPVVIEDDGLFVDSLNGFPGPYSKYVYSTIGNRGILKLLHGKNRKASFRSVVGYCNNGKTVKLFRSVEHGHISMKESRGGWGYDPIFIPVGKNKTYSQIDKNEISHRYMAFRSFAKWFVRMRQSSDL